MLDTLPVLLLTLDIAMTREILTTLWGEPECIFLKIKQSI